MAIWNIFRIFEYSNLKHQLTIKTNKVMENVLVIEEVLSVLNNERAKVHSNFNKLHDEYYSVSDNRKLKMNLGKRKDEESIKLNTIDSLIRKIEKIK